jgi:preprotein translocase SecE subunit
MENVSRYVSIAYIVLGVILAWVLARSFELLLGLAGPTADPALVADLKLSALLGLVASVGLIVGLNKSERASTYVNEVAMEMTKVAWPSSDEIKKSSWTVISVSVIVSVCIFLTDLFWRLITGAIFRS